MTTIHGSSQIDLLSTADSVQIEPVLPPTSSPLAQLLATATGSKSSEISPIVFPLAASQRSKRKPLRFRPKGESRFRPKSLKKLELIGKPNPSQDEKASTIKSRFSGFPKRPRPGPVKQINVHQEKKSEEVIVRVDQTTAQPPLELEDFFRTPEPVKKPTEVFADEPTLFSSESTKLIPFAISNDISSDGPYDQSALFERLQSITGAQPVGVTRDIASPVEQAVEYGDGVDRRDR